MVGAGIFSLLGAAGEVAEAAVWISFLVAGGIAVLQGYSFAKMGARYPSGAGLLEYVSRGFGRGHISPCTQLFKAPAAAFAVCAILPLLPGVKLYQGLA